MGGYGGALASTAAELVGNIRFQEVQSVLTITVRARVRRRVSPKAAPSQRI